MIDFNITNDEPILNDDISLVLQQIDILFDTNKEEILGEPEYGTEYDRYLYNLNISNDGIKNQVISDLSEINLLGFIPEVNVLLLQGTEQDIALINIVLTRDDEQYEKTYKIK